MSNRSPGQRKELFSNKIIKSLATQTVTNQSRPGKCATKIVA